MITSLRRSGPSGNLPTKLTSSAPSLTVSGAGTSASGSTAVVAVAVLAMMTPTIAFESPFCLKLNQGSMGSGQFLGLELNFESTGRKRLTANAA